MNTLRSKNSDKFFDLANIIFMIILTILFLYPLLLILVNSISDPIKVLNSQVWFFPKGINFIAYTKVFQSKEVLIGYKNTLLYTFIGTAVNVCMTIMAAYPLSRKDFYGRQAFILLITITMFFNGGVIPTYLVISKLGLLNHFWVMILPNAVSVFNIFVMRTFFQTSIPEEIFEAAFIDGSSSIKSLFKIVLPLSGPIIAVMVLFYAVEYWNSYFNALIYLSDRAKYPLQLILREILVQNQMGNMMQTGGSKYITEQALYALNIKYALIIIANLPILMLYPFLQRYFVKGIMIGAIKG